MEGTGNGCWYRQAGHPAAITRLAARGFHHGGDAGTVTNRRRERSSHRGTADLHCLRTLPRLDAPTHSGADDHGWYLPSDQAVSEVGMAPVDTMSLTAAIEEGCPASQSTTVDVQPTPGNVVASVETAQAVHNVGTQEGHGDGGEDVGTHIMTGVPPALGTTAATPLAHSEGAHGGDNGGGEAMNVQACQNADGNRDHGSATHNAGDGGGDGGDDGDDDGDDEDGGGGGGEGGGGGGGGGSGDDGDGGDGDGDGDGEGGGGDGGDDCGNDAGGSGGRVYTQPGFTRSDRRNAAHVWARLQMETGVYDTPPSHSVLDYVPMSCRAKYVTVFAALVAWVNRGHRDEFRWFCLLRLFPAMVCAPLRRGSRNGSRVVLKRLELWADFRWQELADMVRRDIDASARHAQGRPSKSTPCGVDNFRVDEELVVTEAALARAARLARDGYLSRAARALEDKPVAPNDEPTWRGLLERHPPLATPRRYTEPQEDWEWIHLNAKEFTKACASMPRSAAMWLQPMGLRTLAREREGLGELLVICQRILNGEVPGRARGWLYNHRIVALSKLSRHQADQEERERARQEGRGETYVGPVRPIAIGDALLRLAERALVQQEKHRLARYLMPFQVGVGVRGGLNMWATTVECLLQRNPHFALVSIDIENCFNAMDRDALIDECLASDDPVVRALARYVERTYPPGMVAMVDIGGAWRHLSMERGTAQGRPLSPALAAILLQPCLKEAQRAMAAASGRTMEEAQAELGVGAYLDDVNLLAEPVVAAAGLRAFIAAAQQRGWTVNRAKTLVGCGYYLTPEERDAKLEEVRHAFSGLLDARTVQAEGHIFLGTPMGADNEGQITVPATCTCTYVL